MSTRRDGLLAEDELFYAQQNAQTVSNAEVYYRAMFGGRVTSWNLRDQHMVQTLDALLAHLDRRTGSEPARIVVWAHNSHVVTREPLKWAPMARSRSGSWYVSDTAKILV